MTLQLQLNNTTLEVKNFNNDFLLLRERNSSNKSLAQIGKAIYKRNFEFVEEVIVTEIEICLKLNQHFTPSNLESLRNLQLEEMQYFQSYLIPIYFHEHKDWREVEAVTHFSKQQIIEKLTATEFSISLFAFLPGFVYMDGLDPSLHVPRKAIPAKYIKANSLAIGGKYIGVYSLDSPGGWHVIGQLPIPLLQIPQLPPIRFNLGDKIRLKAIDKNEYNRLSLSQI